MDGTKYKNIKICWRLNFTSIEFRGKTENTFYFSGLSFIKKKTSGYGPYATIAEFFDVKVNNCLKITLITLTLTSVTVL